MPMRVTQRTLAQHNLANLQLNLDRLQDLQSQLSSGKQISKPSDDPSGTVTALQLRSAIRTSKQYSGNADAAVNWLNTTDTALSSIVDVAQRARALVVEGMSTGNNDASSRSAMADEVEVLRQSALSEANTRYGSRPVFGGTTTGGSAYDSQGQYVGDSNAVVRTVGDGPSGTFAIDVNGPTAFGGTGTDPDLFASLDKIVTDLRTNPSGLTADLGALDKATAAVTAAQSKVGSLTNRVTSMQNLAETNAATMQSTLSNVEDIDVAKTIVDMQTQQIAYQAALGTTAKTIQKSLLDFLS